MRTRSAVRSALVTCPLAAVAVMLCVPFPPAAARTSPATASASAARGVLNQVAAFSARNAWAVGRVGETRPATLIARWNGSVWKVEPSSAAARQGWLDSVAVTSARNAWAAGFSGALLGTRKPMILHWNGSAWARVKTPDGGGGASLIGVAATSGRNAWAVGFTADGFTFIVHWNGIRWRRVPSPSPGRDAELTGVAATSGRNAWAVGTTGGGRILILRWNGTAWKRAPVPDLPAGDILERVAATSDSNAWAVGHTATYKILIMRWNGTSWKRAPGPGITGQLYGITAAPDQGGAWAAGVAGNVEAPAARGLRAWVPGVNVGLATARSAPLILRWNGRTWRRVAVPALADGTALVGTTSTSAGNAWAVGGAGGLFGSATTALVLHWNGRAWQRQRVTR
jgi:hypothetical protein